MTKKAEFITGNGDRMTNQQESRSIHPVFCDPWAIRPDWLRTLALEPTPEGVAVREGDQSHDSPVVMRDGVAVIDIRGVITRYAPWWYSSRTSIDGLAKHFTAALEDRAVKAILLNVDSPGGEVNGVHEMGEIIFQARGKKPIWAYIGGLGDSAAYWLATAADQIVIDATGEVGSIGVAAVYLDWSKYDEAMGLKEIEIVSTLSPRKWPDPASKAGFSQVREKIDDIAAEFVAAVARNRGVTTETVLTGFGQGDVFIGGKAVEAGLVDRLGSFEGTLAALQSETTPYRGERYMSEELKKSEIEAQAPTAAKEIREEGYQAGFEAGKKEGLEAGRSQGAAEERARIKGIEDLAMPGHETLVATLKFDEPVSPETAAVRMLKAERDHLATKAQDIKKDAAELDTVEAVPVDPAAPGDNQAKEKANVDRLAEKAQAFVDRG